MKDPIVEKAKAELAEIIEKMSALASLSVRRKKLEAFIELYEVPSQAVAVEPGRPYEKVADLFLQRTLAQVVEKTTAKARTTNAVAAMLSDGMPRRTQTLIQLLADQDIEIGAADKITGLSNLLSRDGRFEASRAVGWSLKK